MEIKDAYTRWSATYDSDRNLTRDLDQRVTEEAFSGRHYQKVLELGCGTGKNTALLASISNHVLALEFSLGMLRQAISKKKSEHVSFVVADLTKPWPCPSESFDLIVCNLVLEHIPKLAPIFSEARRVLIPAGLFFISELHPYRQYQGTQANFLGNLDRIDIQAFLHHLSDYTDAAVRNGLALQELKERWHEEDQHRVPRLITLLFQKPANA